MSTLGSNSYGAVHRMILICINATVTDGEKLCPPHSRTMTADCCYVRFFVNLEANILLSANKGQHYFNSCLLASLVHQPLIISTSVMLVMGVFAV